MSFLPIHNMISKIEKAISLIEYNDFFLDIILYNNDTS